MAGAMVGGAFLSASLQVLFDRMASPEVVNFFREQKLSNLLLKKLKMKFLAVQVVHNDAEEKQIKNSAVKEWLDELKDAVYDAEDLLDEIATEDLLHKMESDSQTSASQSISYDEQKLVLFGSHLDTLTFPVASALITFFRAAEMAGAMVGGAFLSASLQVLFDRMASPEVVNFFREQKLSNLLLKKLKMKFLAVQAVLSDAEEKQIKNSAVKEWLDELKDAVYDAEDLLDEIATEALLHKMESDSQTSVSQVWNIISKSLPSFGEGIESRVGEIIDRLEYLTQEKDVLELKGSFTQKFSQRWPATSLVDESGVYGRDGNKEEIVEFLLSGDANGNKTSVISIVGMGGMGKTTLAQLVYNDERVEKCFDPKAWVCISDEFDLVKITKTILEAVNPGTSDKSSDKCSETNDLNRLQVQLKERLYRKKFLLVLDDVWNENYNNWDMLQTPFTAGLNGSKIVVTTRSEKVASIVRTVRIYHLDQLSSEDCWSLFAKHAFQNGDSSAHPKLEEIGKEIVKKCKGLPLAAKALGGVLYSEVRVKVWENVLNSEMWELPNDEILPALWLSYYYLPSHLKRCFAYCSIFPKDYEFKKEKLILLWMAEGFLQQSGGKKVMEEVGDGYFHELLSRSFFQKSSSKKSCFVMHDLINDLAQLVSGKFCVQLKDGKVCEIPEKLRHLSYFISEYDALERFETLNNVNGLRTFLPLSLRDLNWSFKPNKVLKIIKRDNKMQGENVRYRPVAHLSNGVRNDVLQKFQYLRVLSLSCYRITDVPDSISNLKYLRYLDLSYTTIERVPESVCSLCNLQTLLLCFCHSLVELPTMMFKLISLRHLNIMGSGVKEMPSQMGQLRSLQKLTYYTVGNKVGARIGELKELSNIGESLGLKDLQNVVDVRDASEANLVGKQHLVELELQWNHDSSDVGQNGEDMILDSLRPHSNLKRFTIQGYGGSKFPDWLGGSSILNMVYLHLWDCKHVTALPPLGQLPWLKHLHVTGLEKVERVGSEFHGNDFSSTKPSFVSLESLSFLNMIQWKQWLCFGGQDEEFPCLKELYVINCPKLTGDLPDNLPLLTKLEIEECEQLAAQLPRVPAIRELVTDNSGGVCSRIPAQDFGCLGSLTTSDIAQWKELPPELLALSIKNCDSLETLLEGGMLQRSDTCLVKDLRIIDCSFSRTLCRFCSPATLKSLYIHGSKKLEFLLPELLRFHHPFLRILDIIDSTCNSLSSFPLSIPLNIFPSLVHLQLVNLDQFESLSILTSEGDLRSFDWLGIFGCPDLVSIELPALNFSASSISRCKNLKSLLCPLACFQSLSLHGCPELIFPNQGFPSNLNSLEISDCNKLTPQVEWCLQGLPSLTSLIIRRGFKELESFPKEYLLPSALTSLEIYSLPNLKSLDSKGLRLLTSLQKLEIENCPKLQSLTEDGLPTSLSFLKIRNCPLLKHRCKFWTGEDWHFISHIPHIVIDDQVL